jgi:hypothetical protein
LLSITLSLTCLHLSSRLLFLSLMPVCRPLRS